MKEIKYLVREINEELESSKEYAKLYVKLKNTNLPTAKKYMEMAKDELKHAMYLHDIASEKISELEENGLEIPEFMKEFWDDSHDCYLEDYAKVQYLLNM